MEKGREGGRANSKAGLRATSSYGLTANKKGAV